ncbi:hypothetical protein [Nostoc sp. NZL]|uniref:hypothetical protein n=1 Tax=Nostoc sp. NZL TaxID=2650612 RepID=UPI001E611329|nr:hypothetical protein [Nostoc sp. NZL]
MKAHRIETKLTKNGILIIEDFLFQAGEAVEILILERFSQPSDSNLYPLQGKVIHYDELIEAVL